MLKDLAHVLRARLIGEVAGKKPGRFFSWPREWPGESEQAWRVSV